MEEKSTRAVKRKAVERAEIVKRAVGKARATFESSGEEELTLPTSIVENSKMADTKEIVKELGEFVTANLSDQLTLLREREERHAEQYRELVDEQRKSHREDAETLATQFEKMRMEKEQARGRQNQKLPQYDGSNLDIDEWIEKIEAVAESNGWNHNTLIETLPASLSGQAKRSFDSLSGEERRTKEAFFQSIRMKLDPQAEKKNKELFMLARRGPNESVMRYMDRLRMYIQRWGGDPRERLKCSSIKYMTV